MQKHIHQVDALEFDFANLGRGGRPLPIVGNLPYNISTPLLFHSLRYRGAIGDMHIMQQKNVIGPGAFNLTPEAASTPVGIVPRTTPKFRLDDEQGFAALVAKPFSKRRRTAGRILKGQLTPSEIEAVGLDPHARPETLQAAEFARPADLT